MTPEEQFGLYGILSYLKCEEADRDAEELTLGEDLTQMGLDIVSTNRLYPTFGGPYGNGPLKTHDLRADVPEEYRVSRWHKGNYPSPKMTMLPLDTLFYLFYNFANEAYQVYAALELHKRQWRYHKTLGSWITREGPLIEQCIAYERGNYSVFDYVAWQKISKEMRVEYADLEHCPVIPTNPEEGPQSQH